MLGSKYTFIREIFFFAVFGRGVMFGLKRGGKYLESHLESLVWII